MIRHSLILFASVLVAQTWPGTYSQSQVKLQLEANLTGTLTVEGRTYPVTARASGAMLKGDFSAEGHSFGFTAMLVGDELILSSGEATYTLRRQGGGDSRRFTHSSGYSVVLPAGWTAVEQTDGALLLPPGVTFNPNSQDNPETYIITAREGYDPREEASVVGNLSEAVTRAGGSGGQRQSARFGSRLGSIYRWDFPNPANGQRMGFDIYIASEASTGYVVVAVGQSALVRAQDMNLRSLVGAISPPKAPPPAEAGSLADNTALAQRWLNKLRGKRVRQFWASQGMSSDKSHWLNSNGTYRFESSSMVAVDVAGASGSSVGRGGNTGRWRIRDLGGRVVLEVRYDNGATAQMRIEEGSPNWYLNGEKAFAVDPR
ncbi:MAG: hypothetical protein K7J46_10105 [Bryobacter sp.]|jgi:hypothetical protein|nr:hypothetical protein [Bryobacter sp. CoA8 C33]